MPPHERRFTKLPEPRYRRRALQEKTVSEFTRYSSINPNDYEQKQTRTRRPGVQRLQTRSRYGADWHELSHE